MPPDPSLNLQPPPAARDQQSREPSVRKPQRGRESEVSQTGRQHADGLAMAPFVATVMAAATMTPTAVGGAETTHG
jgi:hypothetical protein